MVLSQMFLYIFIFNNLEMVPQIGLMQNNLYNKDIEISISYNV